MHTNKTNQGIHSPLPIGRQVCSHPHESRAPLHVMLTWDDKCHHTSSPSFFFSQLYTLRIWYRICLGSDGVSSSGCVPSQIFAHSEPPHWWGGLRGREGLDA